MGESRCIPYAELTDDQRAMVDSPRDGIRVIAVARGYGLDKLVDDESRTIRQAVADQGYGLNKLVIDDDKYVRQAVATYIVDHPSPMGDHLTHDAAMRALSLICARLGIDGWRDMTPTAIVEKVSATIEGLESDLAAYQEDIHDIRRATEGLPRDFSNPMNDDLYATVLRQAPAVDEIPGAKVAWRLGDFETALYDAGITPTEGNIDRLIRETCNMQDWKDASTENGKKYIGGCAFDLTGKLAALDRELHETKSDGTPPIPTRTQDGPTQGKSI